MQLLDTPLTIDLASSDAADKTLAIFLELAQQVLGKAPELTAIENSADVNRFFYHGPRELDEYRLIQPHEGAAAVCWRLERYYTDIADTVNEWRTAKPLRRYWSLSGSLFVLRGGAFFLGSKEMAQLAPFRLEHAEVIETAIWENGGRTLIHPITAGEPSGHELLKLETAIQRDMPGLAAGVDLVTKKAA